MYSNSLYPLVTIKQSDQNNGFHTLFRDLFFCVNIIYYPESLCLKFACHNAVKLFVSATVFSPELLLNYKGFFFLYDDIKQKLHALLLYIANVGMASEIIAN